MSGHSKWATIRRKKEKVDAARGKVFTKLIREISIAAREGGSNIEANPRLRMAVDAAKAANMPADNIERAIKKGAGELEGQAFEEILYEGYGPGGAALMVSVMTDNRKRTVGEVRHIFTKRNGTLAETGAVAWMFKKSGYLTLDMSECPEDEMMEIALEAGATDVTNDEGIWEIYCAPEDLYRVKTAFEKHGKAVASAEISMIPNSTVRVDGGNATTLLKLVEELEEHDDVQQVYSNFDIDDSVIENMK
ncbi:MAG: YebC/PmpR family DNA-binding transcriptional regulator [Calditrichaeota bacterium]|nr:YebC/PmpR family DNA-binding transcriptional regulator [Calditrichota bacterium]